MAIFIRDNYDQMSKAAAKIIAKQVKSKPDSVLGLATGFTPIGVYRELVRMHKEEGLSFKDVKAFTLYEYLGEGFDIIKPYGLDKSCARYMHEEFFKHVDIKKENIHYFDGIPKILLKHAKNMKKQLKMLVVLTFNFSVLVATDIGDLMSQVLV